MSPIALFPTQLVSDSVMLNDGLISSGLLFVNPAQVTNIENLAFFLSADGGTNFESVTNGSVHAFTNTGSDLRYKIVGVNATINIDAVDTGSGTAIPILINGNPNEQIIAGIDDEECD